MGKLGKKARKFAKKNLQSVMKKQRKMKPIFNKKKKPSRYGKDAEVPEEATMPTTGRKLNEDLEVPSLDIFTVEEADDTIEDGSDSEGYLSEDPSFTCADVNENEVYSEDTSQGSELSSQNQTLLSELSEKKKKLESFKEKEPNFTAFMEVRLKDHEFLQDKESDEDEMGYNGNQSEGSLGADTGRLLNSSIINRWCQMAKEQDKQSVLPSLLNAYRSACHYGAESTAADGSVSSPIIQSKDAFCSIVMFMLSDGDALLRSLMGVSSNCKIDAIIKLKSSSKWENVKPLIKSYLRSTLFLLTQLPETDILAFAMTRIRASLILFAAVPSLLSRLTKVAVHLWATGGGLLSTCSFLVLRDMASVLDQEWYAGCLNKLYRALISHCKVVDPTTLKHIEYLESSFVEFGSINMQKSVEVALTSTERLASIVKLALQNKKEALKKICSWEYVLCVDLWVKYVSDNIKDNDLRGILFAIIQIINVMVCLFAGQRYLPLRVKCIHWLNDLSSSSGVFIPISSLALDILESSDSKQVSKPEKGNLNLSTTLKLPKYWLKSQEFQEECVLSSVELLAAHFLQWSYYISFPELATIPVIRLKCFHDHSNVENQRRTIKRLMDQVEKNIDFVERKRENVSFSPENQASADSFLQDEKIGGNVPFIQYYKSILQNATSRRLQREKSSQQKQKNSIRKRKLMQKTKGATANGAIKSVDNGKRKLMQKTKDNIADVVIKSVEIGKRKLKQKTEDATANGAIKSLDNGAIPSTESKERAKKNKKQRI